MVIIDVREKEEFETEYIPDSIFCPLSQLSLMAPGILKNIKGKEVLIMCRSGKRAKLAQAELRTLLGEGQGLKVFEGGILQWKREGRPVRGKSSGLPLMRQVQTAAGLLIMISVLGVFTVSPSFIYLAAVVGLGLTTAGITGFCGMALLLQRMPWNKLCPEKETSCGC